MVEIKIDDFYIEMSGHAGESDVCSAASVLIQALISNMEDLESMNICYDFEYELEDGYAQLKVKPVSTWEEVLRLVFSSGLKGFYLLAENHPDKVKIQALL